MADQSKPPVKKAGPVTPPRSSGAEIEAFVARMHSVAPASSGRGKLIFAMDATMSRQPTWDLALDQRGKRLSVGLHLTQIAVTQRESIDRFIGGLMPVQEATSSSMK
jgi:hypothetical protein